MFGATGFQPSSWATAKPWQETFRTHWQKVARATVVLLAKPPMSNMALLALRRRMERTDITTHGMRSTFRDWAAECSSFPNEVAEMALAHVIANSAEAAYRRGDLFEKRRGLMDAWAAYCEGRDNVVHFGERFA